MEFAILGPLEVRDGPAPVRVPGAKERALLADLLVNAGRVVPADRLVEDLWGDDPPGNPANTLQGRVSALRRALGPAGGALVTRPPGYLLEAGPEQVDAGRFERLVAEATAAAAGEGPRAARQLEEALGLWRGPALAEFADQPWAQAEAARLEELRLAATEALVELRLAAGGHAGLVGELEGLVAAHPTRERLRGQLMVALYRSGRQADALGAYQQAREVLAEELGIDPSPELQRLHQQILLQDPALEAAAPDRALPRHNLPERLTSLVGREGELREVAKLVEEHRLVTVTGPGGAGKTSLAVALAERLAAGYPDGVWLVELAALPGTGPAGRGRGRRPGARRGRAGRAPRPRPGPSGWPASSPTRRCCWSWTTASTWSRPAPGWPGGCWRPAPAAGPGHQPRGAGRARGGGLADPTPGRPRRRRRPTPARPRTPARRPLRRRWPASTPCGCSSSGRPAPTPASCWMRPAPRWWPSCAGAWTACRWPSSWPPPGPGPCRRRSWRPAWRTASGCWPAAPGPSTHASRPCGRPSTGAGTCSRSGTGACCGGCRCSRAAGRSRPPRRCAAATGWRRPRSWTGCSGWSTGP